MVKILIKNGWIVDGTKANGYMGNVVIEEERIKFIGENVEELEWDLLIDATGVVVAPGFIDTHSHSDLEVLLNPELLPKLSQGITTEVLGQDGISMAPLPKQYRSAWEKNLAGLDGDCSKLATEYETTQEYLSLGADSKPAINQCYLLPHGNIRMEAMGLENRQPTEDEIEKMKAIVARDMKAGAIGISDGLISMPCAYSQTEEIIEICKEAKKYDGIYVVHQRSEADDIIATMKEVLDIGKESGILIRFSHFNVF